MNTNNLASLMMINNLKTVKVVFDQGGKQYTFKTVHQSIAVDELVIVFTQGVFKIVRVVKVDAVPDLDNAQLTYDWIVQTIDTSQYNTLKALEDKAAEALRSLEHKALVRNAEAMLSTTLGISIEDLNTEFNHIKEEINNDE